MIVRLGVLGIVLLIPVSAAAQAPAVESARAAACSEWHACREQALAAAERGEYETFHDLAWRAVQTGPPRDPALMYLLARAQALSNRPHDALVMLQRLAEMGVPSDAATSDDFRRTRELPGWPEVLARIDGSPRPAPAAAAPAAAAASPTRVPPAPAPALAPPPAAAPAVRAPVAAAGSPPSAPAAAAASASVIAPVPAPEALRFSSGRFTLGGLAYDAVSQRFLVGDRLGRKLIVVGEGSNRAVDFVRSDSAGFHDISAIEIDPKRGDLWVASAAPAEAGTLHKLQLISGRPLRSFPAAADLGTVTPVDLAVTPAGAVLLLDASGHQLLVLRPGGTALERVVQIDAEDLASVAAGEDENTAYVAHRDGVSRVDLRARTASRLTAPTTIPLAHLERIRWYRRALIGIRADQDSSRRIVRLELNGAGRAITQATMLEGAVPASGQPFVTISGDELVYLVDPVRAAADGSAPGDAPGMSEVVAYRVRLR